jgi:hypothetical protein
MYGTLGVADELWVNDGLIIGTDLDKPTYQGEFSIIASRIDL